MQCRLVGWRSLFKSSALPLYCLRLEEVMKSRSSSDPGNFIQPHAEWLIGQSHYHFPSVGRSDLIIAMAAVAITRPYDAILPALCAMKVKGFSETCDRRLIICYFYSISGSDRGTNGLPFTDTAGLFITYRALTHGTQNIDPFLSVSAILRRLQSKILQFRANFGAISIPELGKRNKTTVSKFIREHTNTMNLMWGMSQGPQPFQRIRTERNPLWWKFVKIETF